MPFAALNRTVRRVALLCSLLLIATPVLFAAEYKEDVGGENYLFVKGKVHSVTPQEQAVMVKPMKGARIRIVMGEQTEVSGFKTIGDLRPDENVKVWYRPTKDGPIGLKIIRLPDLGC